MSGGNAVGLTWAALTWGGLTWGIALGAPSDGVSPSAACRSIGKTRTAQPDTRKHFDTPQSPPASTNRAPELSWAIFAPTNEALRDTAPLSNVEIDSAPGV
jgi:hypothetical protein